MPQFDRYIGIDYSGAQTPRSSLKGLQVYEAAAGLQAYEVLPPPSPRKYWTRQGIAQWLVEQLAPDVPTIVGIDHGFSFPMAYFEAHALALDWDAFLDDFQYHWPTDGEYLYVDFVRYGDHGEAAKRQGNARWRRLCETRCRAKSVFHFDVQGSVAKSTHAGIPWLRYVRSQTSHRLHAWPFDGWDIAAGDSAILEAYPALYKRDFAPEARTPDQHDAYSIASWLRDADQDGRLQHALHPPLSDDDKKLAMIEGWILGVT